MIAMMFNSIVGVGVRQRVLIPAIEELEANNRPYVIVFAHGSQRGNWPERQGECISLQTFKAQQQRGMIEAITVVIVENMTAEGWSFHQKMFADIPNEVWVLTSGFGIVPQPKVHNMITAKEAKTLYDDSGAEVDAYLSTKIEPAIRKAATAGKRTMFHYLDAEEVWKTVNPTPLQIRIIDKLRELGFHVAFGRDESHVYVPRGLADDEGNGPKYSNYGLTIGW